MPGFVDHLRDELRSLSLRDTRLMVAVSGGADSVALLRGVVALQSELNIAPVAAHLNHNLRGEQSNEDARWVAMLCSRLDVPLIAGSKQVAELAAAESLGLEEAARQVRYEFLERVATENRCPYIATAHTADDQAETVLHHVLRGTGLSGLRGISRSRPIGGGVTLVRPMLGISRAEIEAYLHEEPQEFRVDEMNTDESLTRSRIRHALLPLLERDYNPQVREALLRLGRQACDAQETLEILAARLVETACEQRDATTCRLNCDGLANAPRHLLREAFAFVWKQMNWPRQRMGFSEWDKLAAMVRDGGAATFPGNIEARRRGTLLVLMQSANRE